MAKRLKKTTQAEREAIREGIEARKNGKPKKSPYADSEGKPFPAFRVLHEAWLKGWGS